MINSRKIEDLREDVQVMCRALVAACATEGIDLLVTSTYRDHESQNALYAQGRTAPGKIVTNARGGQSFHNWRVAFDVVPVVGGKAIWNDNKVWKRIGELGEGVGLAWAGRWVSFKEMAHFQAPGVTLASLAIGK